ncbi:hypothetical protein [Curtobacterium ammoniigenes]|uniref:hypothetical protein n=1 Tax=Curtobacterium ammoniigenes TaxID=395387 RepID=UPI000832898A|nr:hypothetical protein [Curtobacterium ammoniigenes]
MADGLSAAGARPRRGSGPIARQLLVRYRLMPWWVRVTVMYALTRVLTGVLMLRFAAIQLPNSFTLAHPSYLQYATIWDGIWYRTIATVGYPTTLPIGADGHVAENAWAFMPAYPFLVRAVMVVTGASFDVVSVGLSLLFGLGTVLLMRRLLARYLPGGTATFATLLLCVAPPALMFQTAYAESMGLFLLALALMLWIDGRYWTMLPVVVLLGFTRPAGLAFALAIGIVLAVRLICRLRGRLDPSGPLTVRSAFPPLVVAVASAIVGVAWPAIAWAVTGVPNAYTATELTWRAAFIGYQPLVAFLPWVRGIWWWWAFGLGDVAVLLVALIVGVAVLLLMPAARRIGVEMRAWSAAYFIYLLAIFFPQTSTARILLPMFPLLGLIAIPRSLGYRVALVAGSVVLQWVFMYYCWWVNGADWSPP